VILRWGYGVSRYHLWVSTAYPLIPYRLRSEEIKVFLP
jgi:hypothetical protein